MNPLRNIVQVCTDNSWEPGKVSTIEHWRLRQWHYEARELDGIVLYLHWLFGGRLAVRGNVE